MLLRPASQGAQEAVKAEEEVGGGQQQIRGEAGKKETVTRTETTSQMTSGESLGCLLHCTKGAWSCFAEAGRGNWRWEKLGSRG